MKVKKALGAAVAATGLLIALAGSASVVQAVTPCGATPNCIDSPGNADANTTQLNWSGQGWGTNGADFSSKCGDAADPGSGGYANGASANDYLLWIFNPGGSTNGAATLWIDGVSYGSGNGHQIVTPGLDPGAIGDAHMSFTVNDPGNSKWVLTLSHGCVAETTTTSTTEFTSSESSESTSTSTSTTTSTTEFTSSESSESTVIPSQPNTATIGTAGSSTMSNGLWMLLAGIGVVGGSVLVLMPERAKGKR